MTAILARGCGFWVGTNGAFWNGHSSHLARGCFLVIFGTVPICPCSYIVPIFFFHVFTIFVTNVEIFKVSILGYPWLRFATSKTEINTVATTNAHVKSFECWPWCKPKIPNMIQQLYQSRTSLVHL